MRRPAYVPTGGFTQATQYTRDYRTWRVGRWEGYTTAVVTNLGMPYGYRTPKPTP
jgi:hypothetical protein